MGKSKPTLRECWLQSLASSGVEEGYSIYSEFDPEQHKAKYHHYLEVIVDKDGIVHYAIPSHQELLIKMACKELGVDREGLKKLVPEDYYFDMVAWLCMVTGAVSVWTRSIDYHSITEKHYETLLKLQEMGIYEGLLPERIKIPMAKIIQFPAADRCQRCEYHQKNGSCTNPDYIKNSYKVCCVWKYCKYFKERKESENESVH